MAGATTSVTAYEWGLTRVRESWPRVAEAVGGEMRSAYGSVPRVWKRHGDWILVLDYVRSASATAVTRLRAVYRTGVSPSFHVRDERWVDDLLGRLGFLQDLTIGDPELDERFVFKGTSWSEVRAVFSGERVREILGAQPALDLRCAPSPSYGSPWMPDLRELNFRENGALADVARLAGLFELFEILLPRLCPESTGYENDVGRLVERLGGPGQAVVDPLSREVVWDGAPLRREAAEALGRLGDAAAVGPLAAVLDDPDRELVARAAGALADLAHPSAVAPLVRVLGRREGEVGSPVLAERAAEALERLGRADLARSFERALAGEPSALPGTDHRDEIVAALQAVLESGDFGEAAGAARALGALGAREAVPLLRAKSRGWGMTTTLTEACSEALAEIESRAALPRPAGPPVEGRGTLPRPAGGSGSPGATLPRSVDGEDREP